MTKKHYVARSKKRQQQSKKHKKAKRQRKTKKSTPPEILPVHRTSRPEYTVYEDRIENLISQLAQLASQPASHQCHHCTPASTTLHNARLRMHIDGELHVSQGPVQLFQLPGMSPHSLPLFQTPSATNTPARTGTSKASAARTAEQVAPPVELDTPWVVTGYEWAR